MTIQLKPIIVQLAIHPTNESYPRDDNYEYLVTTVRVAIKHLESCCGSRITGEIYIDNVIYDIWKGKQHQWVQCKCNRVGCLFCDCKLSACCLCGGIASEGCLPSECPRAKMTVNQRNRVYKGELDYKNNQWVNECSINSPFYRKEKEE